MRKDTYQQGRLAVTLDDLTELYRTAVLLRIRDDDAVGYPVVPGEQPAPDPGFVDVEYPIGDLPDPLVQRIPALGKYDDITVIVTMQHKEFANVLRKIPMMTRIRKKCSFVNQNQAIPKIILADHIIGNMSHTRYGQVHVGINVLISTGAGCFESHRSKQGSFTAAGKSEVKRYGHNKSFHKCAPAGGGSRRVRPGPSVV